MEREVRMAEVCATAAPDDILTAVGIGSCLIIALYHPRKRVAALAHAVLPLKAEPPRNGRRDMRCVDGAIEEMLERLHKLGADDGLEARLIGGANMFPGLQDDIGRENIARARAVLRRSGIPIVGESVGGEIGRSVEFSVGSGYVTVRIKF
jgi:chemotaxis protein CheD